MIHGLLGMSDSFIPAAKKLSEKYKVILPDLRNHGNSPHSEDFNMEVLAKDIIDLYHTLNYDSAVLIGHSLGGRVAISASLKYPELFSSLIVEDIAPRRYSGNKSMGSLLKAMICLDLAGCKSYTEIDHRLKTSVKDDRHRQLVLKNIAKNKQGNYVWKLNLEVIKENLESLMVPVFEEVTFSKPALFLKGELSHLIRPEDEKIIYQYFPSAKIEMIGNAGHWIHADQPKAFLEKVMDFLCV